MLLYSKLNSFTQTHRYIFGPALYLTLSIVIRNIILKKMNNCKISWNTLLNVIHEWVTGWMGADPCVILPLPDS